MNTKVTVKYVGEDDYGEHRFDFKAPGREETCWCHTEAQYTAALLAFMLRELQPANSPFLRNRPGITPQEAIEIHLRPKRRR